MYAHPFGWLVTTGIGILYGTIMGGLVWVIWRAATLDPVPGYGIFICFIVFTMCFSAALLIEAEEQDKMKRGGYKNLGHPTKWDNPNAEEN